LPAAGRALPPQVSASLERPSERAEGYKHLLELLRAEIRREDGPVYQLQPGQPGRPRPGPHQHRWVALVASIHARPGRRLRTHLDVFCNGALLAAGEEHAHLATAAVLAKPICPSEAHHILAGRPIIAHSVEVTHIPTTPPERRSVRVMYRNGAPTVAEGTTPLEQYLKRPFDDVFKDLTLVQYFEQYEVRTIALPVQPCTAEPSHPCFTTPLQLPSTAPSRLPAVHCPIQPARLHPPRQLCSGPVSPATRHLCYRAGAAGAPAQ
jgi:hypothetical protein